MRWTRQAKAAANRREHHLRRLQRASTDRDALWAACTWLVAEATRAGRTAEATRAVLRLVYALEDGQPTTNGDARDGADSSPALHGEA